MNEQKTNGWGAYQNKKKEIEKLKKQIVVQDLNNYGEIISVDEKNNFKHVSKQINPFRFPNKIKNEEIIKLVVKDEYKLKISEEDLKEVLKEVLNEENLQEEKISDEILKQESENKETENEEILSEETENEEIISEETENEEILSEETENEEILTKSEEIEQDKKDILKEFNKHILKKSKNTEIINNLIKENETKKIELENRISELTKEYETTLSLNNKKINKLQKRNNTIEELINLLKIDNSIILENDKEGEGKEKSKYEKMSDKCSIINIMKNAFNKQQEQGIKIDNVNFENKICNELIDTNCNEIIENNNTNCNDINYNEIIVDDVKYAIVKRIKEHDYLTDYITYKIINNRNNKKNYKKSKYHCIFCWRKLKWSVFKGKWCDFYCSECDEIVINFTSKIIYKNKILMPHQINIRGLTLKIDEEIVLDVKQEGEKIYINDTMHYDYICWRYLKNNYIYILNSSSWRILDDKYTSPFKDKPTIKYNDVLLTVEEEITENGKYYKCLINDIYLIL